MKDGERERDRERDRERETERQSERRRERERKRRSCEDMGVLVRAPLIPVLLVSIDGSAWVSQILLICFPYLLASWHVCVCVFLREL